MMFGADQDLASVWKNLPSKDIPFSAILKTSIMALIIGFIAVPIDFHKLIIRCGKKLHLTNKYGDENLYTYFLNSKNIKEVYIRDFNKQLTYHGKVIEFSENDSYSEIVLENVKVYLLEDSSFLYEIDKIYLANSKDNLVIEVPFQKEK